MKNTENKMTLKEAIAYDIAQELGKYTLLGLPVYIPSKTPTVIKKKFVDGIKKFFESN